MYGPDDFEKRYREIADEEGSRDGDWGKPDSFDHIDPADMAALREATRLEKALYGEEKSASQLAQAILDDAAPAAAISIVKIATSDPNSRVRLTASQYIIDRALGTKGSTPAKNAPWEDVFSSVTVEQPAP